MSKKDQHLESQATAINTAHAKACESVRTGLEYARSAGEALLNVKRQLDHGEFLVWVSEDTKVGVRTAQGYMRLARQWPELGAKTQSVAHLGVGHALKLLSAPRDEAIRMKTDALPDWQRDQEEWEAFRREVAEKRYAINAVCDKPSDELTDTDIALIVDAAQDIALETRAACMKIRAERQLGRLLTDMRAAWGDNLVTLLLEDSAVFDRLIDERMTELAH